MKVIKWLDEHLEEALLIIFLILISFVMMLQVIVRKIPFIPSFTWAEEFSRFMWIMSVFISLPYTIRKGNMLRVTVLRDLLPQTPRKIINLFVDVVVLICMALLGYHSIEVLQWTIRSKETSAAMHWPMAILYTVAMIGFFLAAIRSVQMLIIHIKHFGERELSTIEQTMAEAAEEAAEARKAEGGE